MPIYVFEDSEGIKHDIFFSLEDAPKIGDEIQWQGKIVRRVAHYHLDTAGIARKTHKYPYKARSQPGQPTIRSQQHEKEYAAKNDMEKH